MRLLLLLIVLFAGTDACMRNRGMVKLTCPGDRFETAEAREKSAVVSWDRSEFAIEAINPVQGIYQTVPVYGASATVRRSFDEGTHYIEYKAVDDSGNVGSCSFSITVHVIRCATLHNPQYGRVTCDSGTLYGSTCSVQCIPGYSIVGVKDLMCQGDGQWAEDHPFCRTTTCPDPGTPLHGTRVCTTATHAYGSICSFACQPGFQLVGNSRLVCNQEENLTLWSAVTPTCRAIIPPKVEACPTNIQVATSETLTAVQKPLVVFRTENGEAAPHACTHYGTGDIYNFTLGTHIIRCTAYDPMFGNQASARCEFSIDIKPNPCSPLPQPTNGILLCSHAQGGTSGIDDLTCTLYCNKGFHPPRADEPITSAFECDHKGQWQPTDRVHSCVSPRRPQEIKLPSEIYYYAKNCSSTIFVSKVRARFRSALLATIRMYDACALNPGDCIVEDFDAECENTETDNSKLAKRALKLRNKLRTNSRRRSQRQTVHPEYKNVLYIRFSLSTRVPEAGGTWPDEFHNALFRLYGMFEYFERQVMEGTFTLRSRFENNEILEVEDSLTSTQKEAICDIGYKFNKTVLLCVPCGAGTYFDIVANRCQLCAPGTFQDVEAEFRCHECPEGTKSPHWGATNITQCVELDECLSSPCLNDGHCIDERASYTCNCRPGSTGIHCEESIYDCTVHACQNGGQCHPEGDANYTCICRENYHGEFCQFHTVHGGWSEWSEWAECTKSCEGGTTYRNRSCDNPEPNENGLPCEGGDTEMRVCNEHECPVCKRLRRPYQGFIKCTWNPDQELQICSISCRKGYAFSSTPFEKYTCGHNTSHMWQHETPDNPRCVLPACTKLVEAQEAIYSLKASFEIDCEESFDMISITTQVQKRSVETTNELPCIQDGTCSLLEPKISGCNERKRRDLLTTAEQTPLDIIVSLEYHGSMKTQNTKELSTFNQNNQRIQQLGQNILQNASRGDFFIQVQGKNITLDSNKSVTENVLVCPKGWIQAMDGNYCVECSPGSFYVSHLKICCLCHVGYYQPDSAQLRCLKCPQSMTTYGRGAILQMECYQTGSKPPEIKDEMYDQLDTVPSPVNLGVLIPCVVVAVILIVVALVIGFVLRKKREKERYEVDKRQKGVTSETGQEEILLTENIPTEL